MVFSLFLRSLMIKLRKTIFAIAPRRLVTVASAAEVWRARPAPNEGRDWAGLRAVMAERIHPALRPYGGSDYIWAHKQRVRVANACGPFGVSLASTLT